MYEISGSLQLVRTKTHPSIFYHGLAQVLSASLQALLKESSQPAGGWGAVGMPSPDRVFGFPRLKGWSRILLFRAQTAFDGMFCLSHRVA